MSKKPPDDLVEMGRISAPFGVKGWVRVQPFTEAADGLKRYAAWWLNTAGGWRECAVQQVEAHGTDVVVKLAGCDDRDAAAALKGTGVAVSRADFPAAQQGEYYWADLVGLKVENSEGLELGIVTSMLETGANAVMVIRNEGQGLAGEERLIPFIAEVVKRVDVAARMIEVEWGADY